MFGTSIQVLILEPAIMVTVAYMEGWAYGCTVIKTKFSRTDGLPCFLTNGAWSSSVSTCCICQFNKIN